MGEAAHQIMVLARPLLERRPEEGISLEELDAAIVTINEVPLADAPDRNAQRTAVHELMRLRDAVMLQSQEELPPDSP